MDVALYFRFILVALLLTIFSACSRTNDLVIPSQQVKSDPECATPEIVTPVIASLEARTRSLDGRTSQLNYAVQDISNSDASASVRVPALASSLFFSFTTLDQEDPIALSNGEVTSSGGVSLIWKGDGATDIASIENGVEAKYPLDQNISEIVLGVEMSYLVDEERDECRFQAQRVLEDVLDSDGNPVLDENGDVEQIEKYVVSKDVNFELVFDIERHPFEETALSIEPSPLASVAGNAAHSVSFNGRFLAVGVPKESSVETGFVLANVTPSSTGKANSGAVMLYEFDLENQRYDYCGLIKATRARVGDRFGDQVLVRGNSLFVSAPGDDSGFSGFANASAENLSLTYDRANSGAVYEFLISEGCTAQEISYLKSPDNSANATYPNNGFGTALAEVGGELLVGAPFARQGGGTPQGAVFQYRRDSDGRFNSVLTYRSIIEHDGQEFGASISATENYVAIGAPKDAANIDDLPVFNGVVDPAFLDQNPVAASNAESGSVMLYETPQQNNVITPLAYLKPQNNDEGDLFGSTVAIVGTSFFIGAPSEDSASDQVNVGAEENVGPAGFTPLDGDYGAVYRYDMDDDEVLGLSDYIKSRQPKQGAKFGSVMRVEDRYLVVANPGVVADFNGYSAIRGHAEVIDHTTYEDPVLLSVFEDDQSASALSADIEALDLYGGTLVLGLPRATVNSVNDAGAFSIW
ncbi:hypothetical protein A3758_08435 [Oleiphilus sp. HI0118]|nr:hypothetical protein A3758_08435 [Oleiphilus sp. HI0118]